MLSRPTLAERVPHDTVTLSSCMTCGDVAIGDFSGGLTGRTGHFIYRKPPRELTIYWEMAVNEDQDGSRADNLPPQALRDVEARIKLVLAL